MMTTKLHNVYTYYKQGHLKQLEHIPLHSRNSSELLHLSFFSQDNLMNLARHLNIFRSLQNSLERATMWLPTALEVLDRLPLDTSLQFQLTIILLSHPTLPKCLDVCPPNTYSWPYTYKILIYTRMQKFNKHFHILASSYYSTVNLLLDFSL